MIATKFFKIQHNLPKKNNAKEVETHMTKIEYRQGGLYAKASITGLRTALTTIQNTKQSS